MKQTCNEEYWKGMETIRDRNPEAPCGRTFDDYDQSTQCPHRKFPPNVELSLNLENFLPVYHPRDAQEISENRGDVGTPSVVVEKTDDRERRVREEDTHRRPHT